MIRPLQTEMMEAIRARLGARPIVLIGLMGAGKSSIGRRLAEQLQLPFVDADHEIEAAAGQSIAEIFATHGEVYFREGERRVIGRLLEGGSQVLATGGGAFITEETRAAVRARGLSLWLRADLALLMKRVSKRNDRPLLHTDNPQAVMQKLMDDRYPIYAEADITVDSRDTQHEVMVEEVLSALSQWADHQRTAQDSAQDSARDSAQDSARDNAQDNIQGDAHHDA